MRLQKISTFLANRYRSLDKGLLYSSYILIFFGILLTFAASPGVAARNGLETFYFVKKQLLFLLPMIGVLFMMSFLDSKMIRRIAGLGLLVSVLLMVYVFIGGVETKGARRWISLFGFSLQPSEFMKPCFAVVCAWLLASGRLIRSFPGYILSAVLYVIVALLLVKQPDVGMLITVSCIFGVQLFLAGIPWSLVFGLIGFGCTGLMAAYHFFDHVRTRVNWFLNPQPGEAYQVEKSMETLKNAGWLGKGPGEGVVKTELPDAHTDFIMAVSAEEFGFIITAVLIGTFAFFIIRGLYLMREENNYFSQLAVGGLLTQFAIQAIINMSSTLNLIPTKGMTLPFISYGGSSLVSIGLAFGIILGLTRRHTLSRGLE